MCPWISRHTINFAYGKLIATKEKTVEEESPDVIGIQNLGGRPVGSTKEAKVEFKSRLRDCLTLVHWSSTKKRILPKEMGNI